MTNHRWLMIVLASVVLTISLVAAGASTTAVAASDETQALSSPANDQLRGVSCVSSAWCMAVGKSGSNGLIEHWNGTSWAVQSHKIRGEGVSCPSMTACVAVGGTTAALWNGTGWTRSFIPALSGVFYVNFSAVSCPVNAQWCIAVGGGLSDANAVALAARWNGIRWKVELNVEQYGGSVLSGVSCTSKAACTAVGATGPASYTIPLAMRWNGSSWSSQTPVTGDNWFFDSASCSSVTTCEAVGYSFSGQTLAQRWHGGVWRLQPPPSSSPGDSAFNGVSCPFPGWCTAVGTSSHGAQPLAELWQLGSWHVETTPLPNGASSGGLASVSCPTRHWCTTVGSAMRDKSTLTLAERWHAGEWSIESTPSP